MRRLAARLKEVTLLWPGLIVTALFWLLMLLQAGGLGVGGAESYLAGGLTVLGLALAWGYIMTGATAGRWPARLLTLLLLAVFLIPARVALMKGFSGYVLLAALAAYLIWQWRVPDDETVPDLLVTGVLVLLFYSVAAERTLLYGGRFFSLVLSAQALVMVAPAGAAFMVVGAVPGDAAVSLVRRSMPALARFPAGLLLGAAMAVAVAKLLWDGGHTPAVAWVTGLVPAALAAGWVWLNRPRGPWPARQPLLLASLGLAVLLAQVFLGHWAARGTTSDALLLAAVTLDGLVALVIAGASLLAGNRPVALLAGLAGLWMLFAPVGVAVEIPVAGLAWAAHLPRLTTQVFDGLWNLGLAGFAVWQWLKGRREPGLHALLLAGLVAMQGLDLLDTAMSGAGARLLGPLLFAGAGVYGLWLLLNGTARRTGKTAIAYGGLGLGLTLLAAALGYWDGVARLGSNFWDLARFGYALFWPPLLVYGLVRQTAHREAEPEEVVA